MQVGRVGLARIEGDDDALPGSVYFHILHTGNAFKRPTQFPHALVAIFAFRRDLNRFNHGLIAVNGHKGIGGIGIVRSRWVHPNYLTRAASPADVSRAIGSSIRQTFSAKTFWPAAFG